MEARHLWRLSLSQRISQSAVTFHRVAAFCFARRAISLPPNGVCTSNGGKGEDAAGAKIAPKKLRIFLPFPKSVAVKSAAQGEMDNIIEAKELQIERKHFYVELRENDRGKFLRITEEAHGRRNSIIVPSTGVDDFTAAISEVLTNNGSAPL
jgi:hypothetical protein